jgi:DNA-binding MarR family transcriptional regulator
MPVPPSPPSRPAAPEARRVAEISRETAARLQSLATRLLRHARTADRQAGIGSAQYSAMAALCAEAPLSLVELARRERVSHATMSRVVAALRKADLVSSVPDPGDRRSRRLALTDEGRTTYERICERRIAIIHAILSTVKPETAEDIVASMDRVIAMLDRD